MPLFKCLECGAIFEGGSHFIYCPNCEILIELSELNSDENEIHHRYDSEED